MAIPLTVRTIGRSPRRERLAMTGGFIQGRSAAGWYRTRNDHMFHPRQVGQRAGVELKSCTRVPRTMR